MASLAAWTCLATPACAEPTTLAPQDASVDAGPPESVVVFRGGVRTYDTGHALMEDGRILELRSTAAPVQLDLPPASDLVDYLAIARDTGEAWYLPQSFDTNKRPEVYAGRGPLRLLGGHFAKKSDGWLILLLYPPGTRDPTDEEVGWRSASACAIAACLLRGKLVLQESITRVPNVVIDVGGEGVEVKRGDIRRADGRRERGYVVLRRDGVVVHVPASTVPEDPQIAVLTGLPPIAHLSGDWAAFYLDREGRAWVEGELATSSWPREYLPTSLIPPSVPREPCVGYRAHQKISTYSATCIPPTEILALRGSRPTTGQEGVFAVYPDGSLRCWRHADTTCPRGE